MKAKDQLREFFSASGPLSKVFGEYEERPQQVEMAEACLEAFEGRKAALIESGTGTGKSLAYLVPSVFWAIANGEKVVISTNTINLQEQLIHKDIPTLARAMGKELKVALVKGRGNYLCMRRLTRVQEEADDLLEDQEREIFAAILAWAASTKTGSRSELDFEPPSELWERVASDGEACLRSNCPYHERCFVTRARALALGADILVANHHLVFADLAVKRSKGEEDEAGVLPPYRYAVFDEAHNVPDVAADYLGFTVSRLQWVRALSAIFRQQAPRRQGEGEAMKERGLIVGVRGRLFGSWEVPREKAERLRDFIDGEISPSVLRAGESAASFFESLIAFVRKVTGQDLPETKLRLLPELKEDPFWKATLEPGMADAHMTLLDVLENLIKLRRELETLDLPSSAEDLSSTYVEIDALVLRLRAILDTMDFILKGEDPDYVYWMELGKGGNVRLIATPLDVGPLIREHLIKRLASTIFTSATLTVNRKFDFIRENLGFSESDEAPIERIFDSPFDYERQALLCVPVDLPNPDSEDFVAKAAQFLCQVFEITKGRAFVLLTAFGMLRRLDEALRPRLASSGLSVLSQGDLPRHLMVSAFMSGKGQVLLGVDSFWQGVDVPGDALSCVVIAKLPFGVPTDPVTQARLEAISARGENAFASYYLPQAVIKFKQGFGRLIRTKEDRGAVVVLDRRLVERPYGRAFLGSLPKCQEACGKSSEILGRLASWFTDVVK